MCIQELFAGVGVLHLENHSQPDSEPGQRRLDTSDSSPASHRADVTAEDSSVSQLSEEVSRLRDEAITAREKIKYLQEQVICYQIRHLFLF